MKYRPAYQKWSGKIGRQDADKRIVRNMYSNLSIKSNEYSHLIHVGAENEVKNGAQIAFLAQILRQ